MACAPHVDNSSRARGSGVRGAPAPAPCLAVHRSTAGESSTNAASCWASTSPRILTMGERSVGHSTRAAASGQTANVRGGRLDSPIGVTKVSPNFTPQTGWDVASLGARLESSASHVRPGPHAAGPSARAIIYDIVGCSHHNCSYIRTTPCETNCGFLHPPAPLCQCWARARMGSSGCWAGFRGAPQPLSMTKF